MEGKRSSNRGTKVLTAILVCALLAGALFVASARWTPSRKTYPIQGIDVSHHQGPIAWHQLKKQGVDFAYIKATEGGDHVDSAFRANWDAAENAGIGRGAYHFFTLCRAGAEQADNFIRMVPKAASSLPPVVDLEFLGNCRTRPRLTDFKAELGGFIAKVEAHFQQPVTLYLTEEFDQRYTVQKDFDRPLWLRSLVFEPAFGSRPWAIWQVSNFRRLDGIDGRVDWNVMAKRN